jgi:hypothetical protein
MEAQEEPGHSKFIVPFDTVVSSAKTPRLSIVEPNAYPTSPIGEENMAKENAAISHI